MLRFTLYKGPPVVLRCLAPWCCGKCVWRGRELLSERPFSFLITLSTSGTNGK